MPRPDGSRDKLLATTARLLRRQGYAATGLAQVLAESGATTGSMYHHFAGGKEELAAAAIGFAGEKITSLMRTALDSDMDVADAVAGWLDLQGAALAANPLDGCPIAPAALESVHLGDTLRDAAAGVFESWRSVLARRLLRDGWPEPEAEEVALAVIALVEGALLLTRTSGDPAALHAAARSARRLLDRVHTSRAR